MEYASLVRGDICQSARLDWTALESLVGRELAARFMWMFEVELDDGLRLHAYKEIWTRCCLHVSVDGRTFYCVASLWYEELDPEVAIAAVFQRWDISKPTAAGRAAVRTALSNARRAS